MIISHEVYIIIMIRLSSMSELINSWMGQSTKFKGQWWPADSANSTISTMERANSAQGKGRIRDPPRVSGRCIFMCQEAERLRRERLGQLAVFEVDQTRGTHRQHGRPVKPVSSSSLAVKEYVRAGAGHHVPTPDELRPPNILVETMEYLITCIADREDHPWHVVYGFINNRCQSIRQDITYQQLEGPEVVHIYELASRFYIYAQYRLAEESVERFDPKLNADQLQQCLSKLLRLHGSSCHDTSSAATRCDTTAEWAEFESYYLLTNLGASEAVMHTLELPPYVRKELVLRSALSLSFLAIQNNFLRLFRLLANLPPLGKCAVHPHIQRLRRQGLRTLCNAYCVGSRPSPFPLSVLARWLMFDGVDRVSAFCATSGLVVDAGNVLLHKANLQLSVEEHEIHKLVIPEVSETKCGRLIFNPT